MRPQKLSNIFSLRICLPRLCSLKVCIDQPKKPENLKTDDAGAYDRLRDLVRSARCYSRDDEDGLMIWLTSDFFQEEIWRSFFIEEQYSYNRISSNPYTDDDYVDNYDYENDDDYVDNDDYENDNDD